MSQDARLDEEQATLRRSRILGMAYIDTSQVNNKQLYPELLLASELYSLKVIPLQVDEHHITFGVTNTTSHQTMTSLRQRFLDQQINYALISDAGYRDYMKLYDPPKEVVYHDISLSSTGQKTLQEKVSLTLEQVRADDMLAYLVQQAHKLAASDIHLETQVNGERVRFRIDGVLHTIAQLSSDKYRILLSAIASAGNVSTSAEQAQQGHIVQKLKMADGVDVDVNLRLETVNTVHGMDVVLRLFNMNQEMYTLDKLGLSETERKVVDGIINRPTGLVLAVGPTGSGKTTTLYSMLNTLNSEERKIITIEDPVEYQFAGITQISVPARAGKQTNFADELRAVLRLDPDVIMVGEIRDANTAKTALQASLTGHLVLSTFHAGSAAAALTRLMDVIGENPLFMGAIRLIMAQRLVRKLDDSTKQAYQPDQATMAKIQAVLDTLPKNTERPDISSLQLYKASASDDNPYGFRGQIALREQMLLSDQVRDLLISTKQSTTEEIEQTAIASGMRTMLQDGILKAIQGITTIEEVYRVVG